MDGDIRRFIGENSAEQLRMLRELCAIPAPSGFEDERAEYCKNVLCKLGADGVYVDGAKNTVFPYHCGGSNGITVIAAHTDTVFPDRESMPFVEEGNILRCPGIGDDTASVTALLMIVKYFLENGIKPKDGILFVCNSCEEGLGNLKGVRRIFKDYAGRIKQFVSFDSSRFSHVTDRCVGSRRFLVTVETEGGHSFGRFGNENAINRIAEIVGKIYSIKVPHIGNSRTTYNVGTISGGTSVNTIAQRAEMLCEYRSDNEECLAVMKEEFDRIFSGSRRDGVKLSCELVGERPCASGVDPLAMDRLRTACAGVIEEITGQKPEFFSGSTDCNIPLSLGVPALCVAAYNGGGAHTRGEWLEKDSLPVGLELTLKCVLKLTAEDELE